MVNYKHLHYFWTVMENVGIDEAFLGLSHSHKDPKAIALNIKQRIDATTGLSCSR